MSNNSWKPYVDGNLVGSTFISEAAIYGIEGGVWAKSDGYKQGEELFMEAQKGFKDLDYIREHGLKLDSGKYFTLEAEKDLIHLKCGGKGIFLAKTNKAIIITLYPEGIQPGDANKALGAVTDYLKGIKF